MRFHGADAPTHMLTGSFGCFIAHEQAIMEVLNSKGAAGTKPCALCLNVVALDSKLHEHGTYCKSIACYDPTEFKLHSDDTVRTVLRDLAAAAERVRSGDLTKGAFEVMQTHCGWSHHEHNLLLARDLNVGR